MRGTLRTVTVLLTLTWYTLAPVTAQPGTILEKDQLISERFESECVTAGERLAAQVGQQIMAQGGNAVDSAVAVGFALAVTLPRAGNLGGGGFALVLDRSGKVHALDFRESAPQALYREFYLEPDRSSRRGPTAVGVPGTVAGLWALHQKFGVLPWETVVEPSYRLAQEGIPVDSWFNDGIASSREMLAASPASAEIFLPGGHPPAIGSTFRQKDLAATLKRLARDGPKDFYRGKTAKLLVEGLREAGGVLSAEDLLRYEAKWREPLSGTFRGYRVWSMPPPSSGGIHILQMLHWLESQTHLSRFHNSGRDLQRLAEVMRLAYCDRAQFLGDPDFTDVPVERLLSEEYLQERARLIPTEKSGDSRSLAPELFSNPAKESDNTTHYNVVDRHGMAVSLTYTLNFSYGSGFTAPGTGFLLNNEMDDFNARPGEPNAYGLIGSEANDVEAGKRPLSSMTPTLVTKDGQFVAAIGAPGGSRIITGVFQVLLNILGYGFNPQTAVSLPRVHHQWYPDTLAYELGISADTVENLEVRGYKTEPIYAVAHVLAILRLPDGHLETGLDPRRPAFAQGR